MRRRAVLAGISLAGTATTGACGVGQAAAVPTETPAPRPTPSPYQVQVQMRPQEARYGQDEYVVIQARFTNQRRGVSGAHLSAIAHYPTGDQTFSAEMTTFPDGRVDLVIPVGPARPGTNVPVEVVMRYQGQEYRQRAGFAVR